MKATFPWLASLLAAGALASASLAQAPNPDKAPTPPRQPPAFPQYNPYAYPYPYSPMYYGPMAVPNTCNPGFYCRNNQGMVYGPNYYLRPGFAPFQGNPPCVPPKQDCCNPEVPGYPTHPYARGPRDYFMVD